MNIGSLIASIGGDYSPLQTALTQAKVEMDKANTAMISSTEKLNNALKKTGDTMTRVGKSCSIYLTAPIVLAGGFAIKMASDFNESLNKVDVAFKGSAAGVKKWSETTLKSFGIAQGTALDMAALFGDMSTSMGLTTSEAAVMSTSLVGLAGDMASFKNIGIDQAMTALNGIFTGETESLKRVGIVMTETNLSAYALSQGIRKNYQDMSQAEKVQLRYRYVMEVTKNSQGDFTRTQGGAANQMRIFHESLKELGTSFGQILLPAFTSLVTKVNLLIQGFTSLNPQTQRIVVIIAGVAAAIGPLLIGLGAILKLIPLITTASSALMAVWLPLTLIIAGITTAIWAYRQSLDQTVTLSKTLEKQNRGELESLRENIDAWWMARNAKQQFLDAGQKNKELGIKTRWGQTDVQALREYTNALDLAIQNLRKVEKDALEDQINQDIESWEAEKKSKKSVTPYTYTEDLKEIKPINERFDYKFTISNPAAGFIKQIQSMQNPLDELNKSVGLSVTYWQDFGNTVSLVTSEMFDKFGNKISEVKQVLVDLGAELQDLATGAIVNVAEGIGTMLSGGSTKEVLQSFLTLIADWAIKLGGLMVAAGIAASEFWTSLMAGPTGAVAAIAIGAALIAAGSLVKGAMAAPGTSSTSAGTSSGTNTGIDLTGNRQLTQNGTLQVQVVGRLETTGKSLAYVLSNETKRTSL